MIIHTLYIYLYYLYSYISRLLFSLLEGICLIYVAMVSYLNDENGYQVKIGQGFFLHMNFFPAQADEYHR